MTPVDMISHLPEALLLRILSELTITKDVVATMVLSKQWECLWKSVPKLVYDDSYKNIDTGRFSSFVDRSLILHEAPVETLHFILTQKSAAVDIGVWITIAVKCRVRNMCIDIDCSSSKTPAILPRSLYTTGSRMLVSLKLKSVTLMDVSTLPSLLIKKKRTRFFGFWLVSLVVTPTHHQLTNPPPINTCMKEKGKFIPNKKNKVRENKRREEERVQERKKISFL